VTFSSIIFILYFLPVFLASYWVTPEKYKNFWILIASLIFYTWSEKDFVFILGGSSVLNFYIVRSMERQEGRRRDILLISSLFVNLALLIWYKYANFSVAILDQLGIWNGTNLLGGKGAPDWKAITLPVGISFFTFQSISYSMDIYRRQEKNLTSLIDYLVYIFSFPQMIAGPIVRYGVVAKELVSRVSSYEGLKSGLMRFSIGLAKKVLIANVVAEYFPITGISEWNMASSWLALLAFSLQIYMDFSGYSDMAIGLGLMMGFHFPENFERPYRSKSITEFWRRWHITLSTWMRDYLYVGLGGNRKGTLMTYRNLIITFFISGLWHGAAMNFVIWGMYHGVFLVLERIFLIKWLQKLPNAVSTLWTFFIVVIGWAIFALEDHAERVNFLYALFDFSSLQSIHVHAKGGFVLALGFLLAFVPIYPKIQSYLIKNNRHRANFLLHLLVGLIALVYLSGSSFNPFIYFRF